MIQSAESFRRTQEARTGHSTVSNRGAPGIRLSGWAADAQAADLNFSSPVWALGAPHACSKCSRVLPSAKSAYKTSVEDLHESVTVECTLHKLR